MSNAEITVIVAGGRKLLREGLCLVLEKQAGIRVIGEAAEAGDVPRLLEALPVQVVIVNLAPPGPADCRIIREILQAHSQAKVIVLTFSPAIEYVQELLEAGAMGCLTKECAGMELVAAVEKVTSDGIYLSPSLVDRVVSRYVRPARKPAARLDLAPREREVLRMIAAGHSAKQIAAALSVSNKTVETHRRRIMQKLNLHSVAELTKYAVMEGLTSLEASL